MAKVFISYSRKDKKVVEKLDNALQKINLDSWIDWDDIPPTADWWLQIQKGIEESDAFLFLISPDSVNSQVCNEEIEYAAKNNKRMLPLVIREVESNKVNNNVSHLNWIFFREQDDFNESMEKLRIAIETDFAWVEFHKRLQVRALEWSRRQDRSRLLRGKDVREVEEQLAKAGQKDPQPTDLQRRYVLQSRRSESRARNLFLILSVVVIVFLVVASLIAVRQSNFALDQANTAVSANSTAVMESNIRATAQAKAEEQARIALSNGLSSSALLLQEKNEISLALLLGVQANQVAETARSRNALFTILKQNEYMLAVLPTPEIKEETFPSFRTDRAGSLLRMSIYDVFGPPNANVHYVLWDLDSYQLLDNKFFPVGSQISVDRNTRQLISNDNGIAFDGLMEFPDTGLGTGSFYLGSVETVVEDVILLPDSKTAVAPYCKFTKYMIGRCVKLTVFVFDKDAPFFKPRTISMPESAQNFLEIAYDQANQLVTVADAGEGMMQVWQEQSGELLLVSSFNAPDFVSLRDSNGFEFLPDRQLIAWGADDNRIIVWDISTSSVSQEYQFDFQFDDFEISPDGAMIAIQSESGTKIYIRDQIELQLVETGIDPEISGAMGFDENSQILAIGAGTQVWVFDTSTWSQITEIEITSTGDGRIDGIFVNNDGTTIAVGMRPIQAGPIARTYLIDIQTGLETGPFEEIVSPILSSDNSILASMSGSSNKGIDLWNLDVDLWKKHACQIANRNLTQAEWSQYMGSEPYQLTCQNLPVSD